MKIKKPILMFHILIAINFYSVTTSADTSYVDNYIEGLKRGSLTISTKAFSVFEAAAINEDKKSMQFLLDYGLRFEQHNIDWIFRCLGFNKKLVSMKWLVGKSMFPSQAVANITFVSAIYDDGFILQWMLSLPLGKGKPDEDGIGEAYQKAQKTGRRGSELLLKLHINLK